MSVQATTWVWEHAPVDGSALLVLLAVADAANREGTQSCQSVDTIRRMARVSERTAQRALRDLEASGVLVADGVHPRYRTTIYSIPGVAAGGVTQGAEGVTQGTGGVSPSVAEGVTVVTPDPSNPTTAPQVTHTAAARRERATVDLGLLAADFDAWWAAYPRKTGKGEARRAYVKAAGKTSTATLLAAAKGMAEYHARVRTEARFVPMPVTWLNQERWDDVLPTVTAREVAAAEAEERTVDDRRAFGDHWAAGGGW